MNLKKLTAEDYAALFPAKPAALRKIACALRVWSVAESHKGKMRPFTVDEWRLARSAGVSRRTLQRYLPVFERYGVVEVKRWRGRELGAMPNTYLLHLGYVIPENWTFSGGRFPVTSRPTKVLAA
jgi:hypothetical protein